MRILLSYLILIVITGVAYGQQTILLERSRAYILTGSSASNREINQPKEAKGSPYLQPDYVYAFVDDINKPFKMRYNAYTDEMEFDNDGVTYDLDKAQYKVVNFNDLNKKYIIANYNDGNADYFGYLVELASGTGYSLYKREKIEYLEGKKSETGFGIDSSPEFRIKKETFFMKMKSGEVIPVPNSKGKMSELFEEKTSLVKAFIKKNKTSLTDENDLKILFQFLNSM